MTQNFHLLTKKLHLIVVKLIKLVEIDLKELEISNSGLDKKKNITNSLTKIITVITNLQKLNFSSGENYELLTKQDKQILDRFLKKNQK
ncbi:MAG: hypothetical protein ISN64_00025 [Rickettsia sp.]|nr:hypothetical protein [Rickettsia sp.]